MAHPVCCYKLKNIVEVFLNNFDAEENQSARYNVRHVHNLFYNMFGGKWIAKHGLFLWSARFHDLTPLDFYVWDCMKTICPLYQLPKLR